MNELDRQARQEAGGVTSAPGIAPGKHSLTQGLAPRAPGGARFARVSEPAPGAGPVGVDSAAADDPFALHLPTGDAQGGTFLQSASPAATAPPTASPANTASAVGDPIVRAAAKEVAELPARILKVRRLTADFQAARNQLDGDSLGEIGVALTTAFEEADAALRRLDEGVDNAELLGPVGIDYAWDPDGGKSNARTEEVARLKDARDQLSVDLAAWRWVATANIRPLSFRYQSVPGTAPALPPNDMPEFVRRETVKSVLFVDTVREVAALLGAAKVASVKDAVALREEAVRRLEFWRSDRDGFLFVAHALSVLGHGDVLAARGADGKDLAKTVEAVARGVPQTVSEVIETVREAMDRDLPGNTPAAIKLLGLARERVQELAAEGRIKAALPGGTHGLTLEHALFVAQEAESGLGEHWRHLTRHGSMPEGLWRFRLRQLETAKQVLQVTSGETAYAESFLPSIGPASRTSLITAGILGTAVIGGVAAGTYLAANAAAVADVAAGAYAATVAAIVRNPYAATAIAEFAASVGFNVIDAGGPENFLESLKTPEGVVQLVMDILVLKQSLGGGRPGADTDAPDAPSRPRAAAESDGVGAQIRDVLDRARAFKAATIAWAKSPRKTGAVPQAVTPEGEAMPLPGRVSGDAPDFSTIYAEQLATRRAARAGARSVWPTYEQWDAEYQAPPAGKSEVDIRRKLLATAKGRFAATKDMPGEAQAELHHEQSEFFAKVEKLARDRREQLEAEAAGLPAGDRAWHDEQIEGAKRVEAAAKVRPVQGRLPINHEFAGKAISLEFIDERLGDIRLPADTRVKLQRLRKIMVEREITAVRYTDDGFPDFSPFVYEKDGVKAEVELYLRGDRPPDDSFANQRYREMICDPTWKKPPLYTWHHSESVGRMLLVPASVHDAFKHTGGVPFYRVLTGDYDAYRNDED